MLTRLNQKNGDKLSILGFGCMRFPAKNGAIDEQRVTAMVRDAIEKGVNYFDTAYIYRKSEEVLGKALAGGYRQRVKIATKLPLFMVRKLENAHKIFDTQLSRLQTDYIDYYLLHMLSDISVFKRLSDLGVIKWLEELKAKGAIKNIGFSFHGTKKAFEELIKAYPWDFCQIQYNYMDENFQATKDGLLLAHSLGIPAIVMEPLRGGKLVSHLPEEVKRAFKEYDAGRSPAEWALRWVWNHPQVTLLLSGMNSEAQVAENIRIASDARPDSLTAAELGVFEKVKKVLQEKTKIMCTGCAYCMPCPNGVDIPVCFSSYNDKYLIKDKISRLQYYYNLGALSPKPAYASLCINCGKCESHCPQNIAIREQLKAVSREMENIPMKLIAGLVRKFMRIK